jgi:hypothetical protein
VSCDNLIYYFKLLTQQEIDIHTAIKGALVLLLSDRIESTTAVY